jgi:hypothetical protein
LPGTIDREAVYANVDAASQASEIQHAG